MNTKIKLLQFAFDGDFVIDSEHDSIESAQETSADLGSKWFFYPLSAIVKGKTILETGGSWCNIQTGECLLSQKFAGKRITTLSKALLSLSKREDMQGVGFDEFEHELIHGIN